MLVAIGPGRYSATRAATSPSSVGARARTSARMLEPSSWNTPTVSPRFNSSNVAGSSRSTWSMSGRCAGVALDHVERPLDDAQVAQAEEVHLQQAELFDGVHFVLGDDGRVLGPAARLGFALHREVLGQGVRSR